MSLFMYLFFVSSAKLRGTYSYYIPRGEGWGTFLVWNVYVVVATHEIHKNWYPM